MFLDRDITFTVDSEATARDIAEADPEFTSIREADGEWEVTRGLRAAAGREIAAFAVTVPGDFDATPGVAAIRQRERFIDDFMTISINQRGQEDLTKIIFDRDGRLPTLISSQ